MAHQNLTNLYESYKQVSDEVKRRQEEDAKVKELSNAQKMVKQLTTGREMNADYGLQQKINAVSQKMIHQQKELNLVTKTMEHQKHQVDTMAAKMHE